MHFFIVSRTWLQQESIFGAFVYDAMQKVASKRNYTFVFDKANQSNLVYADSKYDISDEVLKEMGITGTNKQ
jgi:Skp family chaperone for outer membrane proteins